MTPPDLRGCTRWELVVLRGMYLATLARREAEGLEKLDAEIDTDTPTERFDQ